jgi:2-polyprenyl-3-methyl-5-hydroxy-6-metoxy-1,4-benzoquinol methylase
VLFDISEEHVNGAKKLSIDARCVDFFDFDSSEQFDVIIANEITQFVPVHNLISFAKKFLKMDGLLIFVYLNPKSFRQLIKRLLNPSKKLQPSYLTPVTMNSLMIKNDFKLKDSLGYMADCRWTFG